MANTLFPNTLTRKQYLIRWLVVVVLVIAAMFLFIIASTEQTAEVAGISFALICILAFIYNIFGLSIPRLRNAGISLWAVLVLFIPLGPLIMFVLCVVAREKAVSVASSVQ